ncbi:hypothetical protein VaNZ11_007646 [Volvox africanus]|uniref:Uncharacterized protein n=1 Tax=Volvox africanus TaxID=51714 RepID=A0ABQ5S394_9CHLO|nr:hypothetical protein VaNZ11_007646 [Volvox africanus]
MLHLEGQHPQHSRIWWTARPATTPYHQRPNSAALPATTGPQRQPSLSATLLSPVLPAYPGGSEWVGFPLPPPTTPLVEMQPGGVAPMTMPTWHELSAGPRRQRRRLNGTSSAVGSSPWDYRQAHEPYEPLGDDLPDLICRTRSQNVQQHFQCTAALPGLSNWETGERRTDTPVSGRGLTARLRGPGLHAPRAAAEMTGTAAAGSAPGKFPGVACGGGKGDADFSRTAAMELPSMAGEIACAGAVESKLPGTQFGFESEFGFGTLSDRRDLLYPGDWCDIAAALAEARLRQQLDNERYQQNQAALPINPMPHKCDNTSGSSFMDLGRGCSKSGAAVAAAAVPPPLVAGSTDGAWLEAFMKGTSSRAAADVTPSLEQLARALWALQVLYPNGEWRGVVPAAPAAAGVDADGSQDSGGAVAAAASTAAVTTAAAAAPSHLELHQQELRRQGEAWLRWWWQGTSLAVAQLGVNQPTPDVSPLVLLLDVLQPLVSEVEGVAPPPLRPPGFWRSTVAAAVERQVLAAAASAATRRSGGGGEDSHGSSPPAGASGDSSTAAAAQPPTLLENLTGDKGASGVLRNLMALLHGYIALRLHKGRAVRCLAPAVLQYALQAPYGSGAGGGGRRLLATLPDEDLAALMRWHQLYGSPLQDVTGFVQVLLERSGEISYPSRLLPLPLLLDMLTGISTSPRPLPPPLAGRLAAWVVKHLDSHLGSGSNGRKSGKSGNGSSSSRVDEPDGSSSASVFVGGDAAGIVRASPALSLPTDPRVSATAMATGFAGAVAREGRQTGRTQQQQTLHVVLELFVCVARLAARHVRRTGGRAIAVTTTAAPATAPAATVAVSSGIGSVPTSMWQNEETGEGLRLGEMEEEGRWQEAVTAVSALKAAAALDGGVESAAVLRGDDNPFRAVLDAVLPYLRARFLTCSASELQQAARQLLVARRLFPAPPTPAAAGTSPAATSAAAAAVTTAVTTATAASASSTATNPAAKPLFPTSAAWSSLEAAWEPLLESSGCGGLSPGPLRQMVVDLSFSSPDLLSPAFLAQLLHAVTAEVDRTTFLLNKAAREQLEGRGARVKENTHSSQRQPQPAARTAITPPPPSPSPSPSPKTALSPDEVSHVAAAVARLMAGQRFVPGRVVRRLAAGVLAAAPWMSPTALTQAVWGLAALGAEAPHVIGPTEAELLLNVLGARLAAVPPKSLPLMLWSLARIRLRPATRWMVSYTRIVQAYVRLYDMRQVAQLVWAYGQLTPAAPYSKLYYRPPRRLVRCLLRRSLGALQTGGSRSSRKVPQPLHHQKVSGKENVGSQSLFGNRMAGRLSGARAAAATVRRGGGGLGVSYHYSQLRPGDAALLVFGLAGMEARPGSLWLRRLYGWCGPKLSSFNPRDLGMLLFALGALGAQPPYHWVCRAARCMSVQLSYASGLDVAHAAAGLAQLAPGQVPWSVVATFKAVVPCLLRRRAHKASEATVGDANPANDICAATSAATGDSDGGGAASVGGGCSSDSVQRPAGRRGSGGEGQREPWAGFLRSAFSQLLDNARPPMKPGGLGVGCIARRHWFSRFKWPYIVVGTAVHRNRHVLCCRRRRQADSS